MKKFSVLALAAVCGSALAFDISGGTGGSIPDGTGLSGNDPGSPLVVTLTVSGTGQTVDTLDLAGMLGATHTFLGDLTVVLSHAGVSVDLMDRNYRTSATGFGSGTDLNGDYMFNNTTNGTGGSSGAFPTSGVAAAGTYNRWDNPSFGSSAASQSFANFAGTPLDGDWTLTIIDWANTDTGSVQGMRIVGTSSGVPEPATLAALGIGAAALLRRRRK